MGALEFQPAIDTPAPRGGDLKVDALVRLASEVLVQREAFVAELAANPEEEEMRAILTLGTSAGGARPKAIIAFNETTQQVRSGQVDAGPGFEHWLLKFDGVRGAGDRGLRDPQGWGAVEFAYSRMAQAAGIEMMRCRLLEEHGRRHFMTRRFDRPDGGAKLHVQTIAALEHVSYNVPGIYSYERAFLLTRKLGLGVPEVESLFRRMVFNIVARNQDDHVKNVSYLMGRDGLWRLAPAYDLTFAFDRNNQWLQAHQMTLAGKRDGFTIADLREAETAAGLTRGRAERILAEVTDVVAEWPRIADDVGVDGSMRDSVSQAQRLSLPRK
jgi:serine/threonine-protein kinase HipA